MSPTGTPTSANPGTASVSPGTVARDARVAVLAGLAVHLDGAAGEVDDPVLGHARRRVQRPLDAAVVRQRRVCDLDEQVRAHGVLVEVVARRDDGHVRLGLGDRRRSEGGLDADLGAVAQGAHEQLRQARDAEDVRLALRAHGDELAVEQLDLLSAEHPEADEAVVLRPVQGRTLLGGSTESSVEAMAEG